MTPEVAAVAAAIIGGLVSYIVAHQTAVRTLRAEIVKLQVSTQSAAFVKLLEARLVCYPTLYSLISRFIRTVATPQMDTSAWANLLKEVEAWDIQYAVVLGPRTTNVCFQFRAQLGQAVQFLAFSRDLGEKREAIRERLYRAAEALELELRSDLGIYGVEGADERMQLRTPFVPSYDAREAT